MGKGGPGLEGSRVEGDTVIIKYNTAVVTLEIDRDLEILKCSNAISGVHATR